MRYDVDFEIRYVPLRDDQMQSWLEGFRLVGELLRKVEAQRQLMARQEEEVEDEDGDVVV